MNRKKKSKRSGLFLIFLFLILIIVIETLIIKAMYNKLQGIKVFTYQKDKLKIVSLSYFNTKQYLFTASFWDRMSKYHSPFNDGLNFTQLLKKYIRNRWTDYYGARRGTASCRRIHEGIDLFAPENTPVYPLADLGVVVFATDNPHFSYKVSCKRKNGKEESVKIEYGKVVRIVYPEGIESVYAHLNKVFVKTGDVVYGNTKVGLTGVTGNLKRSGKPSHLHLELRDYKGKSFNPKERLYYDKTKIENFLKKIKLKETR